MRAGRAVVAFVSALRREQSGSLHALRGAGPQERGLEGRLLAKVLAGSDDRRMRRARIASSRPNAPTAASGWCRAARARVVGRMEHPIPGLPGRGSCRAVRPAPRGADRRRGPDAPGRGAGAGGSRGARVCPSAGPRLPRPPGRVGYIYEAGDGSVLGYGYASEVGAARPDRRRGCRPDGSVLGHLLASVRPVGAFSAWVPAAAAAVAALLAAGLRLEDFPALVCWTGPLPTSSGTWPITWRSCSACRPPDRTDRRDRW